MTIKKESEIQTRRAAIRRIAAATVSALGAMATAGCVYQKGDQNRAYRTQYPTSYSSYYYTNTQSYWNYSNSYH